MEVKFGNFGFFYRKKVDFSEIIEACDLKFCRYRQLNEFMKACEY